MAIKDEVRASVEAVLRTEWATRNGTVVPEGDDVALGSGAVRLEAALLYADLADSTKLALGLPPLVMAEIVKAYLTAACKIIRHYGGHIRSFDGDRVMGVFHGDMKCTEAARSALAINWAILKVIRPIFESHRPLISFAGYSISHGIGIDVGEVHVVRSGIRRHNDLVWIGRAPNVAAKLAGLREGEPRVYMTSEAYRRLAPELKFFGGQSMWEARNWSGAPDQASRSIQRSKWTWQPQ